MLRIDSELPLSVGERGFNNEIAQVFDFIDVIPQCIVGRGIACEHEAGEAAVQVKPNRWNYVIGRQRRDGSPPKCNWLAHTDLLISEIGGLSRGDLRKIGPDLPV